MLLGTEYVIPGEYAMALVEMPLLSSDFKSLRRYQILYVVRDDSLAEYREDLGPAESFKSPPFRILGGAVDGTLVHFEHTVAELQDMAQEMREEGFERFAAKMQERRESSTLIQDAVDHVEQAHRIIHNKSVYGAKGSTQRIGFDRKAAVNARR